MSHLKLNQHVTGLARWEQDGQLVQARNTLTHKAADILANAMTRRGAFQISHLYVRYNGEALSPLNVTDLKAVTRNDFLATAGPAGGFYVPLLTAPAVDSSDPDNYEGNRLTYYFRISSGVDNVLNGLTQTASLFNVNTSKISALARVFAGDEEARGIAANAGASAQHGQGRACDQRCINSSWRHLVSLSV